MFAKIEIVGEIELATGLHIGGGAAFSAIGAVDSTVVRDKKSNQPMIPGSSLKGKLRTLISKQYSTGFGLNHKHNDDDERILRLFGNTKDRKAKGSRLLFYDLFLKNAMDLKKHEIGLTEVKFENTINRLTGVANPRQIERAVRGSIFGLRLIYNMENEAELKEDFETLQRALKLLHYDYLGGHGSRGYGKVMIRNLDARCVVGECSESLLSDCRELLKEASYED